MQRIFSLAGLLLLAVTSFAQNTNTTIRGNIAQMKPGTRVRYVWNDKEHLKAYAEWDFVRSTDKGFTIPLTVEKGAGNELILLIGDKVAAGKLLFLYVDQGLVTITTKDSLFTNVTLGGNAGARELQDFHEYLAKNPALGDYESVKRSAYEAAVKKDAAGIKTISAQLSKMDSVRKVLAHQWIDAHPGSAIAVFIMHSPLEPFMGRLTKTEQLAMLSKLSPAARNNKIAADMSYALNTDLVVAAGKPAPDFVQQDTLDKPVALKDFRGKYVLLDFWASWCAPCRAENPNVVRAYQQFKDKGFTVLSVSLDQPGKKDLWLKAIHDDHLTWTHVSDLKFWGNAVAKLYNINAVPANFLIGPDGMILAKNLKGKDLEEALAKYLK